LGVIGIMEPHTHCHFIDIIQQHANNNDLHGFFAVDNAADISHPKTLSYAKLHQKASQVAHYLHKNQLTSAPVLLNLSTGFDFVIGFLGCLYAGVPVVVMDYGQRENGLHYIQAVIEDAKVGLILTNSDNSPLLGTQLCCLKLSNLLAEECPSINYRAQPDDVALIYYSYSHLPELKRCTLSYQELFDMIFQFIEPLPKNALQKGCCSWLSLSHSLGLLIGVLVPFYTGCTSWLISSTLFDEAPLIWLYILSQQKIAITTASSLAYERCLRHVTREHLTEFDLSSVAVCLLGDEPLCYQTLFQFNHTFFPTGFNPNSHYPLYSTASRPWPLTTKRFHTPNAQLHIAKTALEHGKITLVAQHHPHEKIVISLGAPINDDIIIAKNEPAEYCEPFTMGYIWVKNNGQWYSTGDWGFTDNQNHLYRIASGDEVLTIENRQIVASDIEHGLYQEDRCIREPAIVALSNAKQRLIIVQEVNRYEKNFTAIFNKLSQTVRKQNHLQVAAIYLVPIGSLPKNGLGIIDRFSCAALIAHNQLPIIAHYEPVITNNQENSRQIKDPYFRDWLITWLSDHAIMTQTPIDEHEHIAHYGIDSFSSSSLSKAIEYTFGKPITPREIWQNPSVEKLVCYLENQSGKDAHHYF